MKVRCTHVESPTRMFVVGREYECREEHNRLIVVMDGLRHQRVFSKSQMRFIVENGNEGPKYAYFAFIR